MSLTSSERELVREIFEPKIISRSQLEKNLPDEIFDLLKEKDNLKTVRDKILFFNSTKYRPYDSCHITKILTPKFDCASALTELVENLTTPYLIFLDMHFCFEVTSKEDDAENKICLKFQRASKPSSFNENFKISSVKDIDNLCDEVQGKTHNDLLNLVFRKHTELYEYGSSGFRPYQLVAFSAIIQKFPK